MKEFTLTSFAAFLGTLPLEIERTNHATLEKIGSIVETEAKRVIGTYDYNWPPLAESTLERKGADTPLLETGEMRESISHTVVSEHEVQIGSDSDKAVWQELGTSRIPPRPFLQGAAQHKMDEIVSLVGKSVTAALGGEVVAGDNVLLPK